MIRGHRLCRPGEFREVHRCECGLRYPAASDLDAMRWHKQHLSEIETCVTCGEPIKRSPYPEDHGHTRCDECSWGKREAWAKLVLRYRPGNPFARRAATARLRELKLSGSTSFDAAMARSFTLGAGVARRGASRRISQSVNRAVKHVAAIQLADRLEVQAEAFDAGRINAQGRMLPAKLTGKAKP